MIIFVIRYLYVADLSFHVSYDCWGWVSQTVGVGLLRVCPRERGRFGKVGLRLACVRSFRIMDWLSWRLPRFGLSTCAEHVRGGSYLLGFNVIRRVLI